MVNVSQSLTEVPSSAGEFIFYIYPFSKDFAQSDLQKRKQKL